MAKPKIRFPELDQKLNKKSFLAQIKCQKGEIVTGSLFERGTSNELHVGTPVPSAGGKHFGLLFEGVTNSVTKLFTLKVTASRITPATARSAARTTAPATESVNFEVDLSAPSPDPLPPIVQYPATDAEVPFVFYPYGTSDIDITTIQFYDAAGNSQFGLVNQQPNAGNGFVWHGIVECPDTFPTGPSNPYQLEVTNNSGTTTVINIFITP